MDPLTLFAIGSAAGLASDLINQLFQPSQQEIAETQQKLLEDVIRIAERSLLPISKVSLGPRALTEAQRYASLSTFTPAAADAIRTGKTQQALMTQLASKLKAPTISEFATQTGNKLSSAGLTPQQRLAAIKSVGEGYASNLPSVLQGLSSQAAQLIAQGSQAALQGQSLADQLQTTYFQRVIDPRFITGITQAFNPNQAVTSSRQFSSSAGESALSSMLAQFSGAMSAELAKNVFGSGGKS